MAVVEAAAAGVAARPGTDPATWRPFAALGLACGLALGAPAARAEEPATVNRYAIVIGNGDYAHAADLPNATSDARLITGFLQAKGFQVLTFQDLTKQGFEAMLQEVSRRVEPGSDAVFFYAGHGLQIAGTNFIVPVDSQLDDPTDLPFETVSLSNIVEILGQQARIKVFILDSCRNNPFGQVMLVNGLQGQKSATELGFAPLTAPLNSLLAFSTSPGAVAYDGVTENSPFTQALVDIGTERGDAQITEVLADVRRFVSVATAGQQVPWDSSTLIDPFTFADATASTTPPVLVADASGTEDRALSILADPASPGILNLSGILAENLPIGTRLLAALALDQGAGLEILRQPASGTIQLALGQGLREDLATPMVGADQVAQMVYTPALARTRGLSLLPSPTEVGRITDSFQLGAGGQSWTVNISLKPDPCDLQAGDLLDPDGTGIGLYPNEINTESALDACKKAVETYPDVGRFHYQLGRAQVALRDLDSAEASFARAIKLGHTRAFYAMAVLQAERDQATQGGGRKPYPPESLALLDEGVRRGDPYAYHTLGLQKLTFGPDDATRSAGFALLEKSVELGHTFSFNALGTLFLDKEGGYYDPARGLRYWQESARREDIYGFANMGVAYRDGLGGLAHDPAKSLEWFEKAVAGGHPTAAVNIGRMYVDGAFGDQDQWERAVHWYDVGLDRGDGWGGANGAWIIANKSVPGLGLPDAALRAAKAAALGNAEAAEAARALLADLPSEATENAALVLLADLTHGAFAGTDFNAAAREKAASLLKAAGLPRPEGRSSRSWLPALGAAYWASHPFRIDLN